MKTMKEREIKGIYALVTGVFLIFLLVPILLLLGKSFEYQGGIALSHYADVLTGKGFAGVFARSAAVASLSAVVTTVLAFILSYTIHYTNVPGGLKGFIRLAAVIPMLLPTITYGFAIIYSFGKQGLLTRLLGRQLFDIYGFWGLLLGYVIYTLPVSFLLIFNSMGFIDKKFMIVSRIMGDSPFSTFLGTVIRPLLGTLAASFVQCFFLCFTDYGIPASVGGRYDVVASVLYNEMLGSVPDFNRGAVVAMSMLVPSVVSISLLHYLERYNIRYSRISNTEIRRGRFRDVSCGAASCAILASVLSVFAVIFVVPMVQEWPYRMDFTFSHVWDVFRDSSLVAVYKNSILVAALTALTGSLIVYGAALATARSSLDQRLKDIMESIALVTNTIPGMVIGIAFLFTFSGTPVQNTFFLLVICNVVHFFSTPYLMMKSTLAKMNATWETTALLMGDTWFRTILRVVTPNAVSTLLEVFSYYFVNAMVTVSAVIFIAGARTMVITTKIKELQYYTKFNEIFVLSILIMVTNLGAKALSGALAGRGEHIKKKRGTFMKKWKKAATLGMTALIAASALTLTGCSGREKQVVIYSNGDDEAIEAMKHALDSNGFEGKYLLQSFGTSELGGKLLAEGTNIEADVVTMSSFYLESAQDQNHMFADLAFDAGAIEEYPSYYTPITKQEGAIIVNTEMMKEHNLAMPACLKDLSKPEYGGLVSVTDIKSSSTAWLLMQALISEYGEDGAGEVLAGIYKNAGPHIENSGSAPLKKVRAGEVAIGFGLRHQAVADKAQGLPVDYVDPLEGNFSLTESVAVIDKGGKTSPMAQKMAECIIKNGRAELIKTYPLPVYEGEQGNPANMSAYPKVFPQKLTVDLLKQHQDLSESCK